MNPCSTPISTTGNDNDDANAPYCNNASARYKHNCMQQPTTNNHSNHNDWAHLGSISAADANVNNDNHENSLPTTAITRLPSPPFLLHIKGATKTSAHWSCLSHPSDLQKYGKIQLTIPSHTDAKYVNDDTRWQSSIPTNSTKPVPPNDCNHHSLEADTILAKVATPAIHKIAAPLHYGCCSILVPDTETVKRVGPLPLPSNTPTIPSTSWQSYSTGVTTQHFLPNTPPVPITWPSTYIPHGPIIDWNATSIKLKSHWTHLPSFLPRNQHSNCPPTAPKPALTTIPQPSYPCPTATCQQLPPTITFDAHCNPQWT